MDPLCPVFQGSKTPWTTAGECPTLTRGTGTGTAWGTPVTAAPPSATPTRYRTLPVSVLQGRSCHPSSARVTCPGDNSSCHPPVAQKEIPSGANGSQGGSLALWALPSCPAPLLEFLRIPPKNPTETLLLLAALFPFPPLNLWRI